MVSYAQGNMNVILDLSIDVITTEVMKNEGSMTTDIMALSKTIIGKTISAFLFDVSLYKLYPTNVTSSTFQRSFMMYAQCWNKRIL